MLSTAQIIPHAMTRFKLTDKKSFQSSTIVETGSSEFHNLAVMVSKSYFKRLGPKKLVTSAKSYNHLFEVTQ